jgi:hypothetical protein
MTESIVCCDRIFSMLNKIYGNKPFRFSKEFRYLLFLCLFFGVVKILVLLRLVGQNVSDSPDSKIYKTLAMDFFNSYSINSSSNIEISVLRTPGYPLFIKILQNEFTIISIQILLSLMISTLLVLIAKSVIKSFSPILGYIIFITSQIESSIFVYTFKILTELLTAFALTLFLFFLIRQKNTSNPINIFVTAAIMILCCLIRPLPIIFIVTFIVLLFISQKRKTHAKLLFILILFYFAYSSYNLVRAEIFTYTSVQNMNLLLYEGVGAKALSKDLDLLSVQKQEYDLRNFVLNSKPSLSDIDNYNLHRGLELISGNKLSFIKLHFIGTAKILFGPNKAEILSFINLNSNQSPWITTQEVIILISQFSTLIISSLGLIGALYFLIKNSEIRFLSIFMLVYLLFSSGASAYGRFRTPISPILVFFACSLIWTILKSKQDKSSAFKKI